MVKNKMWKHKNFINLQLCAGGPEILSRDIYVNNISSRVRLASPYNWGNNQTNNSNLYTISGNTVVWHDGTILQHNGVDVLPSDEVIYNGQYTTRSATPTLTFKHFFDAGTIGSGTVKFKHYSQQEPTPVYTDCLTFTGETSEFTLKATNKVWDGTLQWSTDHTNWTTLTGTEAMQSVGKKLYLRGKGNTKFAGEGVRWQLSEKAGCSGNIQTLLDWENPPTSIRERYCYQYMFAFCAKLTTPPELPATIKPYCYFGMFYNCTSLTTAPKLPSTTMFDSCYGLMFFNCTNLTTAPELPATTLASYCYTNMFSGCTSLTSAPELPATTLKTQCYYEMFKDCTKLKVNTSSGNKIFTCPSSIPTFAVENMFTGTGGSFTGTPTAGTAYYTE